MKNNILKTVPVLIFVFLIGVSIGFAKETKGVSEKIVRFHIVADSDNDIDQKVKWEVRKRIFENVDLSEINSKENALVYFNKNRENIENIANEVLKENRMPYRSKVYIEKKEFPVREYNSFVLPAGIYDTVSVTLGEGNGKNFFCVMYPSLCMVSSVTEKTEECPQLLGSVLSENETQLVTDSKNKAVIKFKIAQIAEKFLLK